MTFEKKALAAGGHLADDVASVITERTLTAPHLPVEERRALLERWTQANVSLDGCLAANLILEDTALD